MSTPLHRARFDVRGLPAATAAVLLEQPLLMQKIYFILRVSNEEIFLFCLLEDPHLLFHAYALRLF